MADFFGDGSPGLSLRELVALIGEGAAGTAVDQIVLIARTLAHRPVDPGALVYAHVPHRGERCAVCEKSGPHFLLGLEVAVQTSRSGGRDLVIERGLVVERGFCGERCAGMLRTLARQRALRWHAA